MVRRIAIPSEKLIDFLEELLRLPRDVVRIIAKYLWTHVCKARLNMVVTPQAVRAFWIMNRRWDMIEAEGMLTDEEIMERVRRNLGD